MIRSIFSELKISKAIANATRTADANGAGIDTVGYDSVMFVANVGVSGDTLSGSVIIELELEESDDNTTFTDVADAELKNFVAGTNDGCWAFIDDPAEDDAVYICEYRGSKRYVRAVVNVTGTHTNGTPIDIVAIQGHAHLKPVNS